jgi:hypothetical protein
VETVQGDAMAMVSQVFVAPGSAVSADNVNRRSEPARCFHQLIEEIEQTRVIVVNFAGAVITQKVIEFSKGGRNVGVAVSVRDIQRLVR